MFEYELVLYLTTQQVSEQKYMFMQKEAKVNSKFLECNFRHHFYYAESHAGK